MNGTYADFTDGVLPEFGVGEGHVFWVFLIQLNVQQLR